MKNDDALETSADPAPTRGDSGQELRAAATAVEQADVALGEQLASERHDPVVRVAATVGKLGDQGPLYAFGVALVVFGHVARRRRVGMAGVWMLAAVAAADAGKSVTKRLVKRTRPHVLIDQGRYTAGEGGSGRKEEQSFPSGHVAGSVAAARALTRIFPESRPWPILAAAGLGLTRLLKGAHWPLDAVAGAIIGVAAEGITSGLLQLAFGTRRSRQARRE